MSVGAVASANTHFQVPRKLADFAEARDVSTTTLGSPENIERTFKALERIAESGRARREGAENGLANSQTAIQRLSDVVAALPEDISAKERQAWQNELNGELASAGYYRSQIAQYQAQNENPVSDAIFRSLSVLLGKSIDDVKGLYQDRLDKRV